MFSSIVTTFAGNVAYCSEVALFWPACTSYHSICTIAVALACVIPGMTLSSLYSRR